VRTFHPNTITELVACSTRCFEARLVVQTWLLGCVDSWTGVTLRELGPAFGLTGTDSVGNLVRRAELPPKRSASWRTKASEIDDPSTSYLQMNEAQHRRSQQERQKTPSDSERCRSVDPNGLVSLIAHI